MIKHKKKSFKLFQLIIPVKREILTPQSQQQKIVIPVQVLCFSRQKYFKRLEKWNKHKKRLQNWKNFTKIFKIMKIVCLYIIFLISHKTSFNQNMQSTRKKYNNLRQLVNYQLNVSKKESKSMDQNKIKLLWQLLNQRKSIKNNNKRTLRKLRKCC